MEENITYTTEADSAAPTNRVKNYTYTVANKGCASIENTYDKFHRVTAKAVTVGGNDISKEYIYEYTRLSRVLHSIGETQIHNYMLGYDSLSRITSETDSKVSDYNNTYVYDVYGQLIRENNKRLNKTILYTYDNIGNITRVQKYDYTTDDEVSGTPIEDIYTYDNTYPDCLKTFNGKSITYDANGRVATYDGWTYSWERDKLKSIEQTNSTDEMPPKYTFTYNAYGERTEKQYIHVESLPPQTDYLTNSTTTYKYDLCGRLNRETRSMQYSKSATVSKELAYLYDGSEIIGLIYTSEDGTSTYYYDKNIFGDVIAILDNTGNTVVKYKYNAYGNCEYYDSVNVDLAETNPIRYRSYYYDQDTGLYYLQTRYYSPEWRRFISPDSTSYIEPEIPTGLNLYCYCGNDPVNRFDPTGHDWKWSTFWTGLMMVGTAIGAIALSVTTFGAGIPLAMSIVAGATLGAGILTGVNGIATMIDAGTQYNFVRDGVFNGLGWSDEAYNIYAGITEGVAALGSMVLGVYHTTGQYKAAKASQKYLERGYTKAGKNRWVSRDGFRQVRWDTTHHMFDGNPSPVHFNWVQFKYPIAKGVRNEIINNTHVWLTWLDYHF